MNDYSLLSNVLSGLEAELFVAHYNRVASDWRDIDYCPDYSKLYYIVEGTGWIRIGDEEYYPRPGQLVLMPEGVSQSYSSIEGDPFRKYWCHFSVNLGRANLFKQVIMPYMCTVSDRERIERTFADLVHYANAEMPFAKLLAKAKLLELFSCYMMELQEGQIMLKDASSLERLTMILSYIHNNLNRDTSIDELASRACLHPNYFIRKFKEQMGVPPIQYIVRCKIERAQELLSRTPDSVSVIAEQVGFRDISHFSKQFKKIAGMTPTDFRKQAGHGSH